MKITLTGKFEARKVVIDPAVLADAEMLEDLMVAAINDARAKADVAAQDAMKKATGGLQLPPGFKMPF